MYIEFMLTLNWELTVLSRAIQYNNLSGAAQHVGLSQPQLSRIVAKIESELGFPILNRETKRHSTWTPQAHSLVELYHRTEKTWSLEVGTIGQELLPDPLRIGSLEGLASEAVQFCRRLLKTSNTSRVYELDVHDLNRLEELFFNAHYDLLFTIREPGKRKHKNILTLGYQSIRREGNEPDLEVASTYEHDSKKHPKRPLSAKHALISNSLSVRRQWIEATGAMGNVPGALMATKPPQGEYTEIFLLGSERLPSQYWESLYQVALTRDSLHPVHPLLKQGRNQKEQDRSTRRNVKELQENI